MYSKTVTAFNDVLAIHWNGSVWVSPCNGQQHARAWSAMRAELTRYFSDSGEDTASSSVQEQIEDLLSQMVDAAE